MIKWVDGQAFSNYTHWECVQASFWTGSTCTHQEHTVSARVLNTCFSEAIQTVMLTWPVSVAVHLTNKSINRRAFLGQAACFIECGNCINCTVKAWFEMSELERQIANKIAAHWIASWVAVNTKSEICRVPNGQLELAF